MAASSPRPPARHNHTCGTKQVWRGRDTALSSLEDPETLHCSGRFTGYYGLTLFKEFKTNATINSDWQVTVTLINDYVIFMKNFKCRLSHNKGAGSQ